MGKLRLDQEKRLVQGSRTNKPPNQVLEPGSYSKLSPLSPLPHFIWIILESWISLRKEMVALFWFRTASILETLQRRGLWAGVSPSPDCGGGRTLRRSLLCLGLFQLPAASWAGWAPRHRSKVFLSLYHFSCLNPFLRPFLSSSPALRAHHGNVAMD